MLRNLLVGSFGAWLVWGVRAGAQGPRQKAVLEVEQETDAESPWPRPFPLTFPTTLLWSLLGRRSGKSVTKFAFPLTTVNW